MPVYLLLDIAVFALLLFFAVRGYRKGFFMTIASVLIVIAALFGARWSAQNLSPFVADVIEPAVSGMLNKDGGVGRNSDETPPDAEPEADLSAYSFLGMSALRAADFSDAVLDVFSGAKEVLTHTAAAAFSAALAWLLVGIISFILISALLGVLKNGLNHVFRLPGLNSLNRLMGLLVGFAAGLLLCFVLSTLLSLFDVAIPAGEIGKTILFKLLSDYNFIVL